MDSSSCWGDLSFIREIQENFSTPQGGKQKVVVATSVGSSFFDDDILSMPDFDRIEQNDGDDDNNNNDVESPPQLLSRKRNPNSPTTCTKLERKTCPQWNELIALSNQDIDVNTSLTVDDFDSSSLRMLLGDNAFLDESMDSIGPEEGEDMNQKFPPVGSFLAQLREMAYQRGTGGESTEFVAGKEARGDTAAAAPGFDRDLFSERANMAKLRAHREAPSIISPASVSTVQEVTVGDEAKEQQWNIPIDVDTCEPFYDSTRRQGDSEYDDSPHNEHPCFFDSDPIPSLTVTDSQQENDPSWVVEPKEGEECTDDEPYVRSIRFADEQGLPMSTVHCLGEDEDPFPIGNIVVLLLCPEDRKFEFVHAEYCVNARTSVFNLLEQLPKLATNELFASKTFVSLLRTRGGFNELNIISPLHECGLAKNEVVVAVPEGCRGSEILKCALPLVLNKRIAKAVSKP